MMLKLNKWLNEIIWWIISCFVVLLVLFPIYYFKIDYPFYRNNIIFIIAFFIFLRWVLLWHLTAYARLQWLKLLITFTMIPLIFYLSYEFSDFKNYVDEVGLQNLVDKLQQNEQLTMAKYIRSEMVFFSICSLIIGALVPPKLIWNIWKQYNLNKV